MVSVGAYQSGAHKAKRNNVSCSGHKGLKVRGGSSRRMPSCRCERKIVDPGLAPVALVLAPVGLDWLGEYSGCPRGRRA